MKRKYVLSVFIFFAVLMSCEKENPVNNGGLVVWYSETVAQSLYDNGYSSAEFYCNGEWVDTYPVTVYWTAAPDCSYDNCVSISRKPGFYNIIVKVDGQIFWDKQVEIQSDVCSTLKLTL